MSISRRQVLQAGAAGASLAAMGRWRLSEASGSPGDGTYADAWPVLDRFVEQYMREMNAPGMALVLADRDGVQRVAHYGFSDLESKDPPQEDTLFEVGSISKSFVALALLQLRDEGKLDLDRPLVEYLPWLRVESRFALPPGTVTHSFRWTAGHVAFRTVRGPRLTNQNIAQHEFSSGVPTPGAERIRMNVYFFRYSPSPPRADVEVVIERFQYVP